MRQALELALEALIGVRAFLESDAPVEIWGVNDKAITAIKEALAQPEQEPVATLDDLEQEIYENTRQFVSRDVMEWMLKRYYTTPPQRTWVGLTDEEIKEGESKEELGHGFIQGALWAQDKLKEKNEP